MHLACHTQEHGEWTPLHYGLHALASVELSKGGAGKKGGVSEYARQIGRGEKQIREWIKAGEVGKNFGNISEVFDRTYHLAAIHAARARRAGCGSTRGGLGGRSLQSMIG